MTDPPSRVKGTSDGDQELVTLKVKDIYERRGVKHAESQGAKACYADNVIICQRFHMRTSKTNTMTVRISDELKAKLDKYAELTGRSKSHVALAAVEEYLAWRVPQLQDLEIAIAEADQGKFATEDQVNRVFAKYGC